MARARAKKDSVRLYCEIEAGIADRLQRYSDGTGVPKTVVVEKALDAYLALLDAGKPPGIPAPAGT